jgi:hypothetical protein
MSYLGLSSFVPPQETTIELTMEEKNKYISSVLTNARELAEKEEFWRELREEAQNLVLAEEQRENKQKRSKIQALDPSSLAKLIHYIHKQKQKQDKSFLHIIKDIDTDLTDFITAIYSPDIKFNKKQFNNEHYRTFNNTITNTITNISGKITASKNIAGYKRKSKHYKSKHYKSKHYKNTNRKTNKNTNRKKNAQFRKTIRRLNKKTKNM